MVTRIELHRLVDSLPEGQLDEAAEALTRLQHPLLRKLLEAPIDDEPLTDEEIIAIEEGRADIRAGRVIDHEDLKRDFGL